jgi:hypothetical protein
MPVPPFLEKQWNYQALTLVRAYNAFGIEVFAPGDLDFAAGFKQFEALRSQAKFPFVSANLVKRDEKKSYLDPYVILTKGKSKVAIFGLYDETLPLPPELEASDHIAVARELVPKLRREADVVIALTHLGLEKDQELAKAVPGIDAIFGAHTQSYLSRPIAVGDTLIFQTSFRGQHLGYYREGHNGLFQVDDRFNSPEDKLNPMDRLVNEAKAEIARINKEADAELFGTPKHAAAAPAKTVGYQTFPKCAECHMPQYDFYKNTPHAKAFLTLVHAKQSANLDCLKCHTVGMRKEGGWTSVNKLVLNAAGKAIDAESFAKSLPSMAVKDFSRVSKAFINVQCENCHGAGMGHPFVTNLNNKIAADTCLQCHTRERAPNWYKDGKPDEALIATKIKSVSCPAFTKP